MQYFEAVRAGRPPTPHDLLLSSHLISFKSLKFILPFLVLVLDAIPGVSHCQPCHRASAILCLSLSNIQISNTIDFLKRKKKNIG